MMIREYAEVERLSTFEERFEYLKLGGGVGHATFGFDRHINQRFYASREWKSIRDYVTIRDEGCDLGILDRPIRVGLTIHHMNPIDVSDILHREDWILDPNFLIAVSHKTHNAIHYGTDDKGPKVVLSRSPGDTKLW